MTTTPQAALLSDAAKLADEYRVTMPREVFAIWGAEAQAELRRLDALVAHLTADRDDTANELALRTKHNIALTNERDQLLAKLQSTQEPVQAGELPDELEGLIDDLAKWEARVRRYDVLGGCNPLGNTLEQARAALSARKPFTNAQIERLLSESEIVACIAKAGCIGTVKMSYESGPYDIDRPSINASRLYDAIEAAILAKLQGTQEPV